MKTLDVTVWIQMPGVDEWRQVSEPIDKEAAAVVERCWLSGVAGIRVRVQPAKPLSQAQKGPRG